MKRFLCVILALGLFWTGMVFPAAAEDKTADIGNYVSGAHIAQRSAEVNVMLGNRKADVSDPDAWKREIRVFSFDAEQGVFETGDGREPEGEAAWLGWLEDGYGYRIRLNQPGRYLLSGVPYYVLDPEEEHQAALLAELDETALKCEKNTQAKSAAEWYKWLVRRVKSKLPEDRADLEAVCTDPLNALLTGYAAEEAYAPLLRTLLSLAGILTVPVDGRRTGQTESEGTWALCRLDGKWLYMDPALDDLNDAGRAKWIAKDAAAMEKEHVLSEAADAFVRNYILSCYLDIMLRDDRELESRLRLANKNEGSGVVMMFVDGPLYSLGPSGPVTVRIFRNNDDFTVTEQDLNSPYAEWNILCSLFTNRVDWNKQFRYFPDQYGTNYFQEGDATVLEYDRDLTRVVLTFNKPGLYYFLGEGDYFCVLDPEDEDQREIARMLDEARDTIRGDTERETAKKLQDWEAALLKYDREAFGLIKKWTLGIEDFGDEVYTDEIGMQTDASQDSFSALINGKAVCGGYSNLYQLLLKNAGIPAFQVTGFLKKRNMGHAWNILRIDGQWLYADPTWDDKGKSSSSQYFLQTHEQYARHHDDFGGEGTMIPTLFETPVYDCMLNRFYTRYGVRLELPDSLKTLPEDIEAYGFPEKDPPFMQPKITVDEKQNTLTLDFGSSRIARASSVGTGSGSTYDDTDLIVSTLYPPIRGFTKASVADVRIRNYANAVVPTNKPSIEQSYFWGARVLEESNYCYSVPMKKNEIRGYSEKSRRIWIYDMDLNKKAMSWELEKDGTVLTVTAKFDANGKAARSGVKLQPPQGGRTISWETGRDGHITCLAFDQVDHTYLLQEMNDTWLQNRYSAFCNKAQKKYTSLSDEALRAGDVHLYRFSGDELIVSPGYEYFFRPNLYGGEPIATRDELLIWDENGRLVMNPDAKDLNGDPIVLKTDEKPDLSLCVRVPIAVQ